MDLTPAHQLAASRMFLTQEDVDDIINIVKMFDDPRVIDLGAGSGTTALAVVQTNTMATVYSVDNNPENIGWAKKNLNAFGFQEAIWIGVYSDSVVASEYFDMTGMNILLHDADHSEEGVRNDLAAWLPHFSKGSIVWVHDYLPMPGAEETYPGVKTVCDELVEQGYLEPIPTTGIGFAARVL